MLRITGIGGLFFRAADPQALIDWYATHLGLTIGHSPWQQEAGPTIFAPFKSTTDYFPADRAFMINLRVEGLAALIASLTAAGIPVETRPEWDGDGTYGTFARITDPAGTPIELWEPPTVAA